MRELRTGARRSWRVAVLVLAGLVVLSIPVSRSLWWKGLNLSGAIRFSEFELAEPTGSPTATPTASASPTPTGSATPTPTGSLAPTPTASASPAPTGSASPAPTGSPTPTSPASASPTPTASPTSPASASPAPTSSPTPTAIAVTPTPEGESYVDPEDDPQQMDEAGNLTGVVLHGHPAGIRNVQMM